jgi:PIN domain nuclease of toxin-antitoxin system
MRILLDTHVWLWMLTDPERLSAAARAMVEDLSNDLLFSAASSWEIAIKVSLGKLALPEPPARYVPARIQSTGVVPLPIEHGHALLTAELPHHHADPFDRMLVAQAIAEGVPILTADAHLAKYDVEVISAIA